MIEKGVDMLPRPEVHVISLNAGRSGEQLATCGQRSGWNVLVWPPDRNPRSVIYRTYIPVPANRSRDAVLAAIGALVRRYESLRTRFRLDSQNQLWQILSETDALSVEIYAVPEQSLSDTCEQIQRRFAERAIDVTVDLPVRVALVEVQSIPRGVVLAVSHIAADFLSVPIIESTLLHLLRRADHDVSADESCRQPLEQAAFEQSAAGSRHISRAMRAWRTVLESMPRAVLVADRLPPDNSGRFWLGRLRSRMLHRSLTILSGRYRTTGSVVALAAIAVALGHHAGADAVPVGLVFNNRTSPDLKNSVANLAQITCAVVDISGKTFDDVLNSSIAATLAAYKRGLYDSAMLQIMHAEIIYRRGASLNFTSFFNDIRNETDPGSSTRSEDGGGGNDDEGSSFSFLRYEGGDYMNCMFTLVGDEPGWLQLMLKADTTLYSSDDSRHLLEAVEAVLVTATSNSDMAAVRASTGFTRRDRDEDWLVVERCWTYLPAVEQLVRDAVRPAHVEVVVERPGSGEPELVAHVIPAECAISPEEVHAACVALLEAHPTAVTPHRYVVYSNSPAVGEAGGDFRDRTVIAAGPGR